MALTCTVEPREAPVMTAAVFVSNSPAGIRGDSSNSGPQAASAEARRNGTSGRKPATFKGVTPCEGGTATQQQAASPFYHGFPDR
ncbi:hypothetical protein, partial [Archangium sp.]|uniref:hypothetical protein n=1 Tax=Archangium sp. TaxID=1872627 RepID=UPI002D77D24C